MGVNRKAALRIRNIIKPIVAAILLLAVIAVVVLVSLSILAPVRYDVKTGDVAPVTIRATREVLDEITAEILREEARNSVQPIYIVDQELIADLNSGLNEFFSELNSVRTSARSTLIENGYSDIPTSTQEWQSALDEKTLQAMASSVSPEISMQQLLTILNATDNELFTLENIVKPKISTNLAYLAEDRVDELREICNRELSAAQGISEELREIGTLLFQEFLKPTYVVDEVATEEAQRQAALKVDTSHCVIEKGDVIVAEGNTITASQFAILLTLDLVEAQADDTNTVWGVVVVLFVIFATYYTVLLLAARELIDNTKHIAIAIICIVISVLLYWASSRVSEFFVPALIVPIVCLTLINSKSAYMSTLLSAFIFAVMASDPTDIFGINSFFILTLCILTGCISITIVRRTMARTSTVYAGAVATVLGMVLSAMSGLIFKQPVLHILENCMWVFLGMLASIVICVGTMPLWEQAFGLATHARLNELSSLNHPLLRKLETEANGTYQHSMNVGALAEAAAASIGVNAPLARVGGYYHDVGKLVRPRYFIENQAPHSNIHDTLAPEESAAYIIAHQSDGVAMLAKYKLPLDVIKIASEHHGNSLLGQFYAKAYANAPAGTILSERPFRYTGQRPSTVESAIVSLADCCEAAVRALQANDRESIENRVSTVIYSKCNGPDSILANCPLTMKQIATIQKSFVRTLMGMKHERIEYKNETGQGGGNNA